MKSKLLLIVLNVIIIIFTFDILSALILPGFIREFQRNYLLSPKCNKANTNDFYQIIDKKFIDLKANYHGFNCRHPKEKQPTLIITDKFACRISSNENIQQKYDTYFAGDSFVFSSTENEDSIVKYYQKISGKHSLNCGVGASGTRSQFNKFIVQIKKRNYIPINVILIIYENDFKNNFFFPDYSITADEHVFNNPLIVNKFEEIIKQPKTLSPKKDKHKDGKQAKLKNITITKSMKKFLYNHSAFTVLLREFYFQRTRNAKKNHNNIKIKGETREISNINNPITYPINSQYTKPTLNIINKWIAHAKQNHYTLTIATLSFQQNLKSNKFINFSHLIQDNNINVINLDKTIIKHGLSIYYKYDGHLTKKGNAIVAKEIFTEQNKYLMKKNKELANY